MRYEIINGRRYNKLVSVDTHGKSAVAFFDKQRGYWLEAASWSKPGVRLIDPPVSGVV